MTKHRTLLISLAVAAAILMLLLSYLVNLASTYTATTLEPYAPWIYAALGILFLASLGVLIWQIRTTQPPPDVTIEAKIEQTASSGGQIVNSPNTIGGQTNATITQQATDKGRIEGSGNTIQ